MGHGECYFVRYNKHAVTYALSGHVKTFRAIS